MKVRDSKKELTIYINGHDEYKGRPLHKALIDRFLEIGITGCTILKSNSGYGSNLQVKYSDDLISTLLQKESSMVITVVESESKIEQIIQILDICMPQGIVTIKDVEFIRYTKTTVTPEDIRLADKN
ncbi:MAG: DUF190 domain-containing protein [Leptospiraceae bacterium]|nr:DUF190 domain-containing protein [Leptospiraceae bacterium]MCP5494189.1 DUF190 domain-containing protein [Leptospiraceae bacterium]